MSLAVTLFGGVVAIIVLYFALGALKLSSYWRGVISCLVPMAAYAIYFTRHSPGGDVLSVHVAVYLATAGILTALGLRGGEGAKRLHWAPLVLIGFFAAVIVIQAVLLVISTQGLPSAVTSWLLPRSDRPVHTAFPGIVPHNENAAKGVSAYLKQEELKRRTGWQVELAGLESPRNGTTQLVAARLTDTEGQPVESAQLRLALRSPDLGSKPIEVPLGAAGSGRYLAWVSFDRAGPWTATLSIQAGKDRYEAQRVFNVAP